MSLETGYAVPQAPSARPEPPQPSIQSSVEGVEFRSRNLVERLAMLRDRLAVVLRPNSPKPDVLMAPGGANDSRCGFSIRLDDLSDQLRNAELILDDIHDRLAT